MIETTKSIVILSGEGEMGTFEAYAGKRTVRALKMRQTKETCGGDRLVRIFAHAGDNYADDTYVELDSDTMQPTSEMRTITAEDLSH